MKKLFTIIAILFLVVLIILTMKIKQIQKEKIAIKNFNQEYEQYNKEEVYGSDVTTVMNKAIDNNEKFNIAKDENGSYIEDDSNSIKVEIKMILNDKTYTMEQINKLGMDSFIAYFSEITFKCSEIKYHEKTGKVSKIVFESTKE